MFSVVGSVVDLKRAVARRAGVEPLYAYIREAAVGTLHVWLIDANNADQFKRTPSVDPV